jgi:diguanylate cyclase (GGDEF)-like protein
MRMYLNNFSKLFAGDLTVFGGPRTEEVAAGFIRAEQIALVLRHSPSMMAANVCNATVLAIALWNSPDGIFAVLWATCVVCCATFFAVKARRSARVAKPQSVSRRTMHHLVRNALAFGGAWAIVPVAFFANASNGGQLVMTCLCAGMLAGGAIAFATIPVAAIAFTAPILVGTTICIGRSGDFVHLLVAILVIVYACILLRGVLLYSFEFSRRLITQLETEKAIRQDPLTQLSNRFAFNEGLDNALARLHRSGEGFALFLLDLDRFKEVNDHFGHPAGDEFLIQVGTRLRRCTREWDVAARIGGDEFAIIALNLTKAEEALAIADRVASEFANPFVIEGREIVGATSIGIALAPRDGNTSNDLLKRVDIALYRSKKTGPGTIRFFEESDDVLTRERRALQHDLEGAIGRDELSLVYQPLWDLRENRITGFEALLHWRHPVRGLVPPDEFIPIAEESGLICSIGDWVIHRACATLRSWPSDVRIAFNFSAVQFQNANVLQTVVRALAEAGVSPGRLEIEMTESMLMSQHGPAASVLDSLLQLGVTIALDEFGTGYSPLTYLRKLPFSRVKIHRSLVRNMLTQSDCAAIVKSVMELGQDLRICVVAEGVETREQLDYLRQTNCGEVQGYIIGRPVSFDRTLALFDRRNPTAERAA